MKKENEGIALDANVHLFIVHLFTLVLFEQMEWMIQQKKIIVLYKIANNIFRFIMN